VVTSIRHSRSAWAGFPKAPGRDGSTGRRTGMAGDPPDGQPSAATAMAS
jgi:hypothetical protein